MDGDLRNMVMSFRVTELQTLLAYAGKNRSGRKNELQARALELVKSKSSPVVAKIKELYRSMQQSMASGTGANSLGGGGAFNQSVSVVPPTVQTRYVASSFVGAPEKVLQGISHSPFMSFNGNQKPQSISNMPICPDVKLKRLPFYDVQSELIKPTSLMPSGLARMQEIGTSFCLTPHQAAEIAASKEFVAVSMGEQKLQYTVQCQLRFCSLDLSCDQDDQFPPSICVKVNNKIVPLPHLIPSNRPGVEAKRPSRPLNITNYVRLSPTMTNTVNISWASDVSKGYAMSVYLVKKLTACDLLNRLTKKGPRPADYSRGLIKELIAKDDGDCMIAMTSLKVTIACPLGKCRMSLPCRATTCKHLQCFDANLFLQMNERKPTWVCPVCDKPTLFEDLCIDGYFQEVISKMPSGDSMDVELLPDGSWHPLTPTIKKEREKEERSPPAKKIKSDDATAAEKKSLNQTIDLDDDIVIEDDPPQPSTSKMSFKAADIDSEKDQDSSKNDKKFTGPETIIDLTLSDSDNDSDDVPVTRPRRKTGNPKYVIDDDSSSSSSSSTTTEGSAQTAPASPVAPMSPACITLDSRSPSPQPQNGNGTIRDGNGSSNSGSGTTFSSSANVQRVERERLASSGSAGMSTRNDNNSQPNTGTTYDYGHTLGHPSGYPLSRSNSSQQPVNHNVYGTGNDYLSFDNPWVGPSSSAPYPNQFATDFSQIGFPPMDNYYTNYDASRGGSSRGYGDWTGQ